MAFGKGSPTLTALLQGKMVTSKLAAGATVESAMMGSPDVNPPGMGDVAGVQPSPVPVGTGNVKSEVLRQLAEETNDPVRKQVLLSSADELDGVVNSSQPPMDQGAYPPPEQATPKANVVYEDAGGQNKSAGRRSLNDFVDDESVSNYSDYGIKLSSGGETAYSQGICDEVAESNFLNYLDGNN